MRALIVDDNVDITGMFSKYLTLKGFEGMVSNSGSNCMNLIKNQWEVHEEFYRSFLLPNRKIHVR